RNPCRSAARMPFATLLRGVGPGPGHAGCAADDTEDEQLRALGCVQSSRGRPFPRALGARFSRRLGRRDASFVNRLTAAAAAAASYRPLAGAAALATAIATVLASR